MTCKPTDKAAENSPHLLSPYGGEPSIWHWQNSGWARNPRSPWITRAGPMGVLGWRYVGPAPSSAEPNIDAGSGTNTESPTQ